MWKVGQMDIASLEGLCCLSEVFPLLVGLKRPGRYDRLLCKPQSRKAARVRLDIMDRNVSHFLQLVRDLSHMNISITLPAETVQHISA